MPWRWMCSCVQVCESYRNTRLTFHLSVDLFDRYLSAVGEEQQPQTMLQVHCTSGAVAEVNPPTLQLIAVTALFIASKMEEIYPPKLEEYAYTTDGACSAWVHCAASGAGFSVTSRSSGTD